MGTLGIEAIISLALAALTLIVIFVGHYFYVRGKLHKAAAGAITNAEQDYKTGEEKLELAVEQVYSLVPTSLKVFIHRSTVRKIVQAAFNKIEDYAKKQVEKKSKQENNEVISSDEKVDESQSEATPKPQSVEPLDTDEKNDYVNRDNGEHTQAESTNAIQWYLV